MAKHMPAGEPRDADRLFVANIVDHGQSGRLMPGWSRGEQLNALRVALEEEPEEPREEPVQRLMLTAWSELEADEAISRIRARARRG